MSAETLRRAAALMRERAEGATVGPWVAEPIDGDTRADIRGLPENITYDYRGDAIATAADSEFGACLTADAEHIASWHPAVALAVADWLLVQARLLEATGHGNEDPSRCACLEPFSDALAVARAYLGEEA